MATRERLDLTLRLVQGAERASIAELARRLGVSEMTVRRDLDALQAEGLVQRVRGGAVATRERREEAGYTARLGWQSAVKDRLGAATAALVQPGETVLLDAGTTTVHVAAHLAARAPLTVAVLSLQAAAALADVPGVRLLVLGGESRPGERSLVGPLAHRAITGFSFDTFVMSIGGISAIDGWSEFALEDAAVKQAALPRARRVVVVSDATKLGVRAFVHVAPLDVADVLVTDAGARDPDVGDAARDTLTALTDAGVDITYS
ncbi:DeoR/GlpR family DNA-binding transcription regulator [Motilibacter deserti]|uniref:DeoR/GlpR transcriptional regulator n=1 Tax=Motilibacter deserti TaxID=2714956 RepID=A0ABX0GXA8_9ACTN|nr:DeoR/GlpR family DNA-binding transcription regulator [Motilibacter deserti]NHC14255.1 DeoR/GlpR transcriptional regulator [Motilibacter deserti]